MPYRNAPPTMAARTIRPLSFQIVLIGAPAPMASIARRSTQGMTLVIADDARTIRRPAVKDFQYGL